MKHRRLIATLLAFCLGLCMWVPGLTQKKQSKAKTKPKPVATQPVIVDVKPASEPIIKSKEINSNQYGEAFLYYGVKWLDPNTKLQNRYRIRFFGELVEKGSGKLEVLAENLNKLTEPVQPPTKPLPPMVSVIKDIGNAIEVTEIREQFLTLPKVLAVIEDHFTGTAKTKNPAISKLIMVEVSKYHQDYSGPWEVSYTKTKDPNGKGEVRVPSSASLSRIEGSLFATFSAKIDSAGKSYVFVRILGWSQEQFTFVEQQFEVRLDSNSKPVASNIVWVIRESVDPNATLKMVEQGDPRAKLVCRTSLNQPNFITESLKKNIRYYLPDELKKNLNDAVLDQVVAAAKLSVPKQQEIPCR